MRILLPKTLKQFSHDDICRYIKHLNDRFKKAQRASWPKSVPDLEDPVTREVVEVAVSRDLKTSWGQCLYYYRMGASEIHLVLSPRLFIQCKKDECAFVRENPIPNVTIYQLPEICVPPSRERNKKNKKPKKSETIYLPMLQFVATAKEIEGAIETNPKYEATSVFQPPNLDIIVDGVYADQDDLQELKKTIEDPDSGQVPILTPLNNISYITKYAYNKEKNLSNFWRPLSKSMIENLIGAVKDS